MRIQHPRRWLTQRSLVIYPNQLDPVPNLCIVIIMMIPNNLGIVKSANLSFLVVVVEMPTILSLSRQGDLTTGGVFIRFVFILQLPYDYFNGAYKLELIHFHIKFKFFLKNATFISGSCLQKSKILGEKMN